MNANIDDKQLLYFSKHILLPKFGIEGQEKLLSSEITIFGLGGIGSLLSIYSATSGIKKINLVDFDKVEISNLQRQITYSESDVGMYKTDATKIMISRYSKSSEINTFNKKVITENDVSNIINNSSVVLDGTDNFETRKLINSSCVKNKKKLIIGAVEGFHGQIFTYLPGKNNPCYSCIYRQLMDNDNSCSDSGVMAPLVGTISSFMAIECIKVIVGLDPSYFRKLFIIDGLASTFRYLSINKDPGCHCAKLT